MEGHGSEDEQSRLAHVDKGTRRIRININFRHRLVSPFKGDRRISLLFFFFRFFLLVLLEGKNFSNPVPHYEVRDLHNLRQAANGVTENVS